MSDAYYSAYGRGGRYGSRDKTSEEESMSQCLEDYFSALKKKQSVQSDIDKIIAEDQELIPLIKNALARTQKGSWPFPKALIQKNNQQLPLHKLKKDYPNL